MNKTLLTGWRWRDVFWISCLVRSRKLEMLWIEANMIVVDLLAYREHISLLNKLVRRKAFVFDLETYSEQLNESG